MYDSMKSPNYEDVEKKIKTQLKEWVTWRNKSQSQCVRQLYTIEIECKVIKYKRRRKKEENSQWKYS